MKRIYTTVGYREEYPNGEIRYYGDCTDNGFCYKDMNAWLLGKGVCYIPECDFEEDSFVLNYTDNTRDIIVKDMANYLPECDVKFIEGRAECVLAECDWQCLTTMMFEIDWEEDIEAVYEVGTKVYWLDPEGLTSQEYEIFSFEGGEVIGLRNEHSECEALLSEVYRKAENKACPYCGNSLYHEHYSRTEEHYPYFCPECDENFFEVETRN